jgi:neuropeptide Y receptor
MLRISLKPPTARYLKNSLFNYSSLYLTTLQVIVGCPAKDNLQMLGAILILLAIWLIAFFCAVPLYIYKTLTPYKINITKLNIHVIYYCYEDWPETKFLNGRVYYSLFALTLQYLIPILVVSCAYQRIYSRLKKRIIITQNVNTVNERIQERRNGRTKRTNFLLMSIALIFGISWLPINIYNLSTDLYYSMNEEKFTQIMYIIYAACHMIGMSSGEGFIFNKI